MRLTILVSATQAVLILIVLLVTRRGDMVCRSLVWLCLVSDRRAASMLVLRLCLVPLVVCCRVWVEMLVARHIPSSVLGNMMAFRL